MFRRQMAGNRAAQRKLDLELAKNRERLTKLQLEVGKTLTGESSYSADDLSRATEEFDRASLAQQKMIACHLFRRIEIGRGYQIRAELNMTYRQFCSEWGGGDLIGKTVG